MGIKLFGYVIKGNHYHLILQTTTSPLSKVMHRINGHYSRDYNARRKRTGHVFGGRYKGIPIQDERYLLAVLRYVHRNPLRAGICQRMSEYRWSCNANYRRNQSGLVEIETILDFLSTNISTNRRKVIEQYVLLMEAEDEADYSEMESIGDNTFVSVLQAPNTKPGRKPLAEILTDTGASPADIQLIIGGSRKRHLIPYKIAYAKEALRHNYTFQEIGTYVSLSATAVYKMVR